LEHPPLRILIRTATWILSGRSWVIDMDKDGDHDIVMVGGDQVDSRGAWLENNGRENPGFTVHLLPQNLNKS
jgi:hypothetical protein